MIQSFGKLYVHILSYFGAKCISSGSDSSVFIATGYELDGPRIESRWDRDFPHVFRPALASCKMGTGFFPVVESGRGMTLTPHPFQCRGLKQIKAIRLLSLRVFVACKKGETYQI
jgi:hypothetical protein